MKLVVDRARCVGHARCFAKAPDLFPLDDEGFALPRRRDVGSGQEALARAAAMACPERAIAIEEESEASQDGVRLTFVSPDGTAHPVVAEAGRTLLEIAQINGIEGVIAECGGGCACATCHVYLDAAGFQAASPPETFELEMLDGVAAPRLPTSRLSCQVIVLPALDAVVVTVPDRQM